MLEILQIPFPKCENQDDLLNQIAGFLKKGAENCQRSFKEPDDDWAPMYLVVFDDQPARIITSTIDKHRLANAVALAARESGAIGIGQLASSWRRMQQGGTPPKGSIAGKPGSEEGVILNVYSRTDWRMEWAPIKRDETQPPTLGDWEVMMKREKDSDAEGAMFDPMLMALRKN